MSHFNSNILITGVATIGILYGLIRISDTLRKPVNNDRISDSRRKPVIYIRKLEKLKTLIHHIQILIQILGLENSLSNETLADIKNKILQISHEELNENIDSYLEILEFMSNSLEKQNQDIQDENSESLVQQEENSESLVQQEENSESSDEQEEELSPEIRKQLWKNLKFKQINIFWKKCSPCFNHNGECCCCFDSGENRKITPCGHIICYNCCVDLFDSTISQEEQGVSETGCPVCRRVIEPELVCEWCKNQVGIDSDVLYCQDSDKIVHEVCFRFACPNGSNNRILRISQ